MLIPGIPTTTLFYLGQKGKSQLTRLDVRVLNQIYSLKGK